MACADLNRNPLHVILSSGKELRDLVEERIVPVQAGVGSELHSVLREEIDRVVDHSQIMERLVNDVCLLQLLALFEYQRCSFVCHTTTDE